MSAKSVFVHGRPGPYPLHGALAAAIGADFVPIDFLIRWHDIPSRRLRKYLSWFLCALFFPRIRTYQTILADSVHFLPVLMRRLGRLRKDQRLVALLSDETPFFLKENVYPPLTGRALLSALQSYDALVCLGQMQARLAESLLDGYRGPRLFTVRGGGVDPDRLEAFNQVRPALDGRVALFVGFGPTQWRGWYKGLDLLFDAIAHASTKVSGLRLCIVGDWDPGYIETLKSRLSSYPSTVELAGSVWDLSRLSALFARAAVYVHLGRGDAFPHSVLEAMCAGLPCIVSEWTGTREAVELVDPKLVVPCDARSAGERIQWYFDLSPEERRELSVRSRGVAGQYTEERAVANFVEVFRQLLRHFDLPDLSEAVLSRNPAADRSRWWPKPE